MLAKLAIVTSHPIQYNAPWFSYLIRHLSSVRVFYLWDAGVSEKEDRGFGRTVRWDIPLLSGYDYEFVPNESAAPGTYHFRGLNNPALKQRILNFHPTAVLLMGYNYLSYYRLLAGWYKYREIPLLFRGDSHRLVPQKGLKAQLRRQLISTIFRGYSAFLYVGQANYRYFRYHGVKETKLFFAPHCVDNERFSKDTILVREQAHAWKRDLGIPESHRVVLFTGKFEAKKRPLDLIQAFIDADIPNTSLLMVGNGQLEPSLRQTAAGRKNIYFAPFQNQTLMPRTYAAGDLFVLPSYGNGETWGLAVNEAMCLARPIIVSNHVGCAEDLVRRGENGLIFPAGDTKALATCLREALANTGRLRDWGQASLKIVGQYSYKQATEGLEKALTMLQARKTQC